MATTALGFDGPGCPESTGGRTAPSPLAQITIDSLADTVFVGLTSAPDAITEKIPGSCASNVTAKGVLFPFPFSTIRSTELTSGISKGTCALIWLGDTYSNAAGKLPNTTCTPPKSFGNGKPFALRVTSAKLLPNIDTIDPRAATGILDALRPVAAFISPFGLMMGIWACTGRDAAE